MAAAIWKFGLSVNSGTSTLGVIWAEDKGVNQDSSPHPEEDPEWMKYPLPSPPLLYQRSLKIIVYANVPVALSFKHSLF